MPAGLQIWDAAADLILDGGDRISRVLAVITISGNGSTSHGGLATGSPFWMLMPTTAGWPPVVSLSGTTLSWSYPAGLPSAGCNLVYGVY